MLGAIAGDIIGSVYEWNNIKRTDFELFNERSTFTDDTVLTVAVADCILYKKNYAETFKEYGRNYPDAGYGCRFYKWIFSDNQQAYNSFGNGSAMRVSPVGFAFHNLEKFSQKPNALQKLLITIRRYKRSSGSSVRNIFSPKR